MDRATCPKCSGSTRRPAGDSPYRHITAGYDHKDNSLACDNCGGQTMSMRASGEVRVDPATGLGCLHSYRGVLAGNCYRVYICTKCGDRYDIDSGD